MRKREESIKYIISRDVREEIEKFYQNNKVIKNAKEIYCLESSVQCFIDGIALELDCPKYLLSRPTRINGKAPWKQSLGENRYGNTGSKQWLYDYMK